MPCRSLRAACLALIVLGASCAAALAFDPRQPNYEFKYTLYPPGGFSPKSSKAVPRAAPKNPKAFAIIGKDGKFADFAQWYYAIGSDPKNFEKWWYGYFTDRGVWKPSKTPVFEGTGASNQGHRIIAWLGVPSIINGLFKYHPDPDPAGPKSIFYKWNKLPEEKRAIGRKMIVLCSRRLWLDWAEKKGPTWCWVRDGQPIADTSRPSEAPFLPAYDGYGDNQIGWAKAAWDEMFGDPQRNTNDGVQALLAIAQGRVHKNLKTPKGQQVPGRYDFDEKSQAARMAEDEIKLDPKKERPGSSAEK